MSKDVFKDIRTETENHSKDVLNSAEKSIRECLTALGVDVNDNIYMNKHCEIVVKGFNSTYLHKGKAFMEVKNKWETPYNLVTTITKL